MDKLQTYGDLKKIIQFISRKQTKRKIFSKGKELALDQLLGFIPGASNAKTLYDFIKAAVSKPDTKKTTTWLDKLAIDPHVSAIVDDTVENNFMADMAKSIEAEPDDKPLEDDFDMNKKLTDFLSAKYDRRTITGIKENQMKKQNIKEVISKVLFTENFQGQQINKVLFSKLGIQDFDPVKFATAINNVKSGQSLTLKDKETLANTMVAMIKTSDDALLTKIFQNLKQIEAK